jgi:hypothetical protein
MCEAKRASFFSNEMGDFTKNLRRAKSGGRNENDGQNWGRGKPAAAAWGTSK